jgi:hypothetical protein
MGLIKQSASVWKSTKARVVGRHGQELADQVPTPPTSIAELQKDIGGFRALPGLLSYVLENDAYAPASRISTWFSPMMQTMHTSGWGDAICAFCGREYESNGASRVAVWHAGHALAEMWESGELQRRIEALVVTYKEAQEVAYNAARNTQALQLSGDDEQAVIEVVNARYGKTAGSKLLAEKRGKGKRGKGRRYWTDLWLAIAECDEEGDWWVRASVKGEGGENPAKKRKT